MPFDALRFLFGRTIIENQGVPTDQATRLAILPGIMGGPLAQSLIISTVVGRNNATPAPTVSLTPGTGGGPTTPTGGFVQLPDLRGAQFDEAAKVLTAKGLKASKAVVKDALGDEVIDQDPKPGVVAVGRTVTLFVGQPVPPAPAVGQVPPLQQRETADAAKARFASLGFTSVAVQEVVSQEAAGYVIDFDPDPGQIVPLDKPIIISVAKAPPAPPGSGSAGLTTGPAQKAP
jgi:hypothetical protein